MFPHVSVHGRQGVVQQVHGPVTVHRSGQAHPLLLTSRQVHSLDRAETFTQTSVVFIYFSKITVTVGEKNSDKIPKLDRIRCNQKYKYKHLVYTRVNVK